MFLWAAAETLFHIEAKTIVLVGGVQLSTQAARARGSQHTHKEGPLKKGVNGLYSVALSVSLGGHLFLFAFVGVYYLLTQDITLHLFHHTIVVKYGWDHLFTKYIPIMMATTWETWRHLVRDAGEIFYGSLGAQFFVYNPLKHTHELKPITWWDRLEMKAKFIPNFHNRDAKGHLRVTGLQMAVCWLVAAAYAAPAFLVVGEIVKGLNALIHFAPVAQTLSTHPSLVQKLYTDSWNAKVVALCASFMGGRRPMKPVFAFVQYRLAERQVAKGRKAHFWHPKGYRDLVRQISSTRGQVAVIRARNERGWLVQVPVTMAILVVTGLAVYGIHILAAVKHG